MTQLNSIDRLSSLLAERINQAGWKISHAVQQQLVSYLLLLEQWNQAYNLTSVRELENMVTQHILDSLAVVPYIHGEQVIDVGTGAGLPGIPLALALPRCQFTLLDSNGKKTRFLTHVMHELHIHNVKVVQSRAEDYKPEQCFDTIIARALCAVPDFLAQTKHLCCDDGKFLAMKGQYPTEELEGITAEFSVYNIYDLKIPGLDAKRHLIVVVKNK